MKAPPTSHLGRMATVAYGLVLTNNAWHIGEVYLQLSGYAPTVGNHAYCSLVIAVAELPVLLFAFTQGWLQAASWLMVAVVFLGNLDQYQLHSPQVQHPILLGYAFAAMFSLPLPFLSKIIVRSYQGRYRQQLYTWRSQLLADRNTAWKQLQALKQEQHNQLTNALDVQRKQLRCTYTNTPARTVARFSKAVRPKQPTPATPT